MNKTEIVELQKDKTGRTFRMIGGKKIYQIENPEHKEVNDIINMHRASKD